MSNHPNLVGLREAFVSGEWDNTPALFFAHDYYPGGWHQGEGPGMGEEEEGWKVIFVEREVRAWAKSRKGRGNRGICFFG